MRARLIEVIRASVCVETWDHCTDDFKKPNPIYELADHLIANGVILPPVKIGDTVWFQWEALLDNGTVFAIGIDGRNKMWISVRYISGLTYYHTSDDIGKTVFLTREEAEAALKGGAEK